ncbi:hypothetical protein EHO61_10135 [Leptospira fluminis]|uniref:Uncharacterized protein n=1 Tax=Leptospira fluminis TaxID=2484979 RepID=A0A4R9GN01_9LEPT|nr:hypothetical protein [Leptospira fluminis]TGK17829.1 hypothetical protein EHO61_10135 [Leptospira fluminis]
MKRTLLLNFLILTLFQNSIFAIDIDKEVKTHFSSLFTPGDNGHGIYAASKSDEKLIFNAKAKVIKGMDPKTLDYIYGPPSNTKWSIGNSGGLGEYILLVNKFDFLDMKESKSDDKYIIKFQNSCKNEKGDKFKAANVTKAKITLFEGSFNLINAMVPKVTSKVKEKKSFEVTLDSDSDVTIDLNYKPTEGFYYVAKLEILAVNDLSLKKFCTDKFSIGKSE